MPLRVEALRRPRVQRRIFLGGLAVFFAAMIGSWIAEAAESSVGETIAWWSAAIGIGGACSVGVISLLDAVGVFRALGAHTVPTETEAERERRE